MTSRSSGSATPSSAARPWPSRPSTSPGRIAGHGRGAGERLVGGAAGPSPRRRLVRLEDREAAVGRARGPARARPSDRVDPRALPLAAGEVDAARRPRPSGSATRGRRGSSRRPGPASGRASRAASQVRLNRPTASARRVVGVDRRGAWAGSTRWAPSRSRAGRGWCRTCWSR